MLHGIEDRCYDRDGLGFFHRRLLVANDLAVIKQWRRGTRMTWDWERARSGAERS